MSSRNTHYPKLIQRHPNNPILTADDWPYAAHIVFNPGATRLQDGTTLLLCRVEDRRGMSHLTAARSKNGVDNWQIDPEPTFAPDPENHPDETWGVEDARIVYVEELGKYVVTYTAYSEAGPCVALATTEDFHTFERYGVCIPPEDKDAALFPTRIGDSWAMIHRPMTAVRADMAISYSANLSDWGRTKTLLRARQGAWWDANKIGLSPPPIRTDEGWLVMYHGVRRTVSGGLYRQGLALFALDEPSRCLLRSDEWVFGPEEEYERVGDIDNVVFVSGFTEGDDGDSLNFYYGAADTSIALATSSKRELLHWLKEHGQVAEAGAQP